jgi:hypothetical protein
LWLNITTRVGLFGADLTEFEIVCILLDNICDIADYADYNGWGIGVNWESNETAPAM